MARSSTGARGRRTSRAPAPAPRGGVPAAAAPSLASATLPRVWQAVGYQALPDPAPVRALFEFAAVPWPGEAPAFTWAAETGERRVGGVTAVRVGEAVLLHGPVVVSPDTPLEIAAQLVAAALDHATALGATTVFARPHGLDRVWVRFGFVPVPEGALPPTLAGEPATGLYAWRGGSALWTPRAGGRETGPQPAREAFAG